MEQSYKELTVDLGERSYPIYIGSGLLSQIGAFFKKHQIEQKSPLMVITDTSVARYHLSAVSSGLREAGYTVVEGVVEAGEQSKSLQVLEKLVGIALKGGLDRKSTIVALGGGVVGDLAGFTAASYMRGIRFVQIPTTILAHDSSVGGKVAVNHPFAKNTIGAFHQPELVLYDTDTLLTLPQREIKAGLAEVVKHGFIRDASFVSWCEEHANELLDLHQESLAHALHEGCKVKANVVSVDEREGGLRAILNLGHTIGHALEAVAGYGELLHGEAISIGMVGSAQLAVRLGYSKEILETTQRVLERFELPVRIPDHLSTDAIMEAMMHDKKFKEGRMVFVVPTAIGKVEIRDDIHAEVVREIVEGLKGKEDEA